MWTPRDTFELLHVSDAANKLHLALIHLKIGITRKTVDLKIITCANGEDVALMR